MNLPGSGSTVSVAYVETLTCFRAWIGSVTYTKSFGPDYPVNAWSASLVRQIDWLSSQFRALKVNTPYGSVKMITPSGDVLTLLNAYFAGYGPGSWSDPTHSKPNVALEMVSYNCEMVYVGNTRILPPNTYNWWQLNA